MFASGTPMLKSLMTPDEIAVVAEISKAVKPSAQTIAFALCPYCHLNSGEVRVVANGGWVCCCLTCGAVPVDADDLAAFALDEHWLHRNLRSAQDIQTDIGSVALAEGVWLLGSAKKTPVALTRDIHRLWREANLLDRVRVNHGAIRVIAPAKQIARGAPADAGVEWLGLEDKFRLRGDGISFIGAAGVIASRRRNDPSAPVHGPFSADFRLVYLDGEEAEPIRLSKAQADVFRALWEFEGKDQNAEAVMKRAGRKSTKPIDVFKAHLEAKRAYEMLVKTNQQDGLYRMPCAAR